MRLPAIEAVVTTSPIVGNKINVGMIFNLLSIKLTAKLNTTDFSMSLNHYFELIWCGIQDLSFGIMPV